MIPAGGFKSKKQIESARFLGAGYHVRTTGRRGRTERSRGIRLRLHISGTKYSRNRIDFIRQNITLCYSYRVLPVLHQGSPLETIAANSRFCTKGAGYGGLYATPEFATAFVETTVRDRFTQRQDRIVELDEVRSRAWARISTKPGETLALLNLRKDGCIRIDAPTDTVRARITPLDANLQG